MATQPDELVPPPDDPRTVVEIEGRYYILATGSPADENAGVLKHGATLNLHVERQRLGVRVDVIGRCLEVEVMAVR